MLFSGGKGGGRGGTHGAAGLMNDDDDDDDDDDGGSAFHLLCSSQRFADSLDLKRWLRCVGAAESRAAGFIVANSR